MPDAAGGHDDLALGARPQISAVRLTTQQQRLTLSQTPREALQAALDFVSALQQLLRRRILDESAQNLRAPDQRRVAIAKLLERLSLAPVAVGHVVGFGNRLRADLPL